MKLKKCHPTWPEHADFDCPHCGELIEDVSDFDSHDWPDDIENERRFCPCCKKEIRVSRRTKIVYEVEKYR
jgi:hypothetical protein